MGPCFESGPEKPIRDETIEMGSIPKEKRPSRKAIPFRENDYAGGFRRNKIANGGA